MSPAMSMKFPPLICTPELEEKRGIDGKEKGMGGVKQAVHRVLHVTVYFWPAGFVRVD
jgi:hypothetical protein